MRNIFLVIALLINTLPAETIINANPDIIASGLEQGRTTTLLVGDKITYKGITISGLIHIRNEERYNEGLFPNHNWRGVISLRYSSKYLFEKLPFILTTGFEHESAHPTMGIMGDESSYYYMIYDGNYRRYMLNSVLLSLGKNFTGNNNNLLLLLEYHLYFYSKNSPELLNMATTTGNSFNFGIEYRREFKKFYLFSSVFNRVILKSKAKANGEVYTSLTNKEYINYPIINSLNTVKIKVGISLNLKKINRELDIYSSYLNGNIYGFVDSRESRDVFTILGIVIKRDN